MDHENATTATMAKKQRAMKKIMYTVLFCSTGLVKAIKFAEEHVVTAKCLPDVLGPVQIPGVVLHHPI